MIPALLYGLTLNAHEHPELEWCLDDHPYWHFYPEDSEPYGPTVDLMRIIAERAGIKLRFSPNTPFSRCLRQMEQGQTDLMSSLNHSEERARYMHFIPYDEAKPEVVYLLQESTDIASWNALSEHRIAVVKDYVYSQELNQKLAENQLNLVEAERLDDAFALLLLGEVDAVIGPAQSSINVIQHNPRFHQRFKKASYEFNFQQGRTVNLTLSRYSPHQELLPKLQQVVQQMVESGEVKQFRADLNVLE
ncbi:transporter substrate-binding domain-containing protein [Alkalimonas collagenimarina]|uniref:Transporter substrate-binding domain-containing protein n=1 Tax=Alkalimonas collagenimarina TaxID=400390 RepID=A0ABT9GXH7_9GAMM|nr:transporter substrate-binding domain-containing protein [Alkalimonas collagenimarina]MDP4535758.1 transporter substrate-binding domain-containing protein [Alkalimonas collagenimarina]